MQDEIKNDEIKEEIKEDTVDASSEEKVEAKEESQEETKKEKKNKYKEQIAKLEAEKAELKNEYLKALADAQNTKKRLQEEAIKDRKYASQKVVGKLINPIDMLVQIVNMPAPSPEVQNYQIGFQMIANQLVDILKSEGLAAIEALDKEFDPRTMEAVQTEENLEKEDNIVLQVMQSGYMYKDRVLRPARVVVNKKNIEKKEEE